MSILKNLIRVANSLDGHSLIKEADILDSIIKKYSDLLEEQYESSDYYIAYHCGKPDIESDFRFDSLGSGEGTSILGPGIYSPLVYRYAKFDNYKELSPAGTGLFPGKDKWGYDIKNPLENEDLAWYNDPDTIKKSRASQLLFLLKKATEK